MNQLNNKIIHLEDALENSEEIVVLCHGHFNIIHPGHIRYLDYARQQGTRLVVSVQGDATFLEADHKHHFKEDERASGVAAIQTVHEVVLLGEKTLKDAILKLKPSVLVLGTEYEYELYQKVKDAVEILLKQGGRVLYRAGESYYASTELLQDSRSDIQKERNQLFQQACEQQGFCIEGLPDLLYKFKDASLLVIGDTILDRYVACDALGMSAEAPIIVARELEDQDFLGGAAIVASHAKSIGANCSYLSVVGADQNGAMVKDKLVSQNVEHVLIEDSSRPTTLKVRYMIENQKIFRVSRLKEHSIPRSIEDQLIMEIRRKTPGVQGILISDFVYGVITPRILKVIKEQSVKNNLFLFGDLQCSSQVGNVAKFKNFHLLCPTEREARIALGSQDEGLEQLANSLIKRTSTRNLILKLGAAGFIVYENQKEGFINRQHFPALNPNPVDVTGAGDSLLTALAVGICAGIPLMQSSAIGACLAKIAVQTVGNFPVSRQKLQNCLDEIIKLI